jgi:ribosomal protein L11 methyltransferase
MKRRPLWKVSIATSAEAEDAVSALLAETLGQPVSSYTDIETGQTSVTAYLQKSPARSCGWRAHLQERLKRARGCGLGLGSGRISLASVRWENWAESWKRHFKPISVGSALMVKPSWSRLRPRKGQAVVVLDPGLSFGTGQHPTTAFCLRQLVKRRRQAESQSMLDIGTGSGILAIAASRLGYSPVHAFDLDPDAIQIARANARQNGLAGRIRFSRQDLASYSSQRTGKYTIVCANLLSSLLLAQRKRILTHLQAGGVLVVAGILKEEFAAVQAAYEAAGLRLIASRVQREWRSGAFSKEA